MLPHVLKLGYRHIGALGERSGHDDIGFNAPPGQFLRDIVLCVPRP